MTVIMGGLVAAGADGAGLRPAHPLSPVPERMGRRAILAGGLLQQTSARTRILEFPQRFIENTVYTNLHSDRSCSSRQVGPHRARGCGRRRPEVIEGEPIYLSLLARAVLKRRVRVPSVKVVILTYGKASREHGRRIAEAFRRPAESRPLTGSTPQASYPNSGGRRLRGQLAADRRQCVHRARVVSRPPRGVQKVGRRPRGRRAGDAAAAYLTGDVVQRFRAASHNSLRGAGRHEAPRLHFRRDGSLVSPADIDRALPDDFACWHYCLIQTGETAWKFDYVAEHSAGPRT
ncbi:MAG: hypothetical protein IPN03_15675 [Holophagales bacterium]|nr:hypothetical protein [Holophagales bacterium]